MRVFKYIAVYLTGMIFLVSSSGFMMYKTNCSCTGTEQTSVFVRPETCANTFHQHHQYDLVENEVSSTTHECHNCTDHTKDCGCDSPEIFFFKLKDKAVDDEANFVHVPSIELFVASTEILEELNSDDFNTCTQNFYTDPPSEISSSLDFLIQIHQLKIPLLA